MGFLVPLRISVAALFKQLGVLRKQVAGLSRSGVIPDESERAHSEARAAWV